jgi:tRNA threonylcarbamoyladenosine biosynthesis protein TsaE
MTVAITAPTAESMRELGARIAAVLRAGDVVVLNGSLGAGKTTLAQGIGSAMRVRGGVTSPTFVISRVHPPLEGGPALVHVDAYRLAGRLELDDLDLDASLDDSVTLVEWGEDLVEGLSSDRLEVAISRAEGDEGDETRQVHISGVGTRWRDVDLARLAV